MSTGVRILRPLTHGITGFVIRRTLLGILGPLGYLPASESGAVLHGDLERAARAAQVNTFGGGVNEVQREIVASVGLGMARSPR